MRTIVLAALLAAHAVPAPASEACDTKLMAYSQALSEDQKTWTFSATSANGGRLDYFGAEHSNDPAAPQVRALQDAFARAAPTVTFFEGGGRDHVVTQRQALARALKD